MHTHACISTHTMCVCISRCRRQGSLVLLLTPYALHTYKQKQQQQQKNKSNNNNITIAFIDSWWWSLNAIFVACPWSPHFSCWRRAADASGLSLFVFALWFCFCFWLCLCRCFACTLLVSVSAVEVSFCFFFIFCCFCFCFVADHESPNSNSRRLLFDLNGLCVSVIFLRRLFRVIPLFECALCVV